MSLNQMYQNIKKDKQEATDRVIYQATVSDLQVKLDSFDKKVESTNNDLSETKVMVKELKALNMPEFTDKHARMKENFNKLVASYNESTTEANAVILDLSKRMNVVESRLSL